MQVRRKELTNERRTRAWQNCMVQDKRLELLRRWQRDLNPPCLPIPPILHISYIQPANTAIVVTLKTVSTMLSYTIRLWRFLLTRSTFLWSRSISSFLLSRSNLYLHHASPDMKSPRSILAPPYIKSRSAENRFAPIPERLIALKFFLPMLFYAFFPLIFIVPVKVLKLPFFQHFFRRYVNVFPITTEYASCSVIFV